MKRPSRAGSRTGKRRCDGLDTTIDWQLNESRIAVWPIGAFEQHSRHLPLATDNLVVERLATEVAEGLGACLLPVLPFGTSFEHTGFRGSISLTPELLMAMVEHVAAELEAQSFRYLVIVNGHGGNFSLGPVIRKINRQDRRIKAMLADSSSTRGAGFGAAGPTAELHAGAGETSTMLALFPELVRDDRADTFPHEKDPPFYQRDLNHFGFGWITEGVGVWGAASRASAEAGRKRFAERVEGMIDWVGRQIGRFEKQWRYGGPRPVALRPIEPRDIDLGMSLVRAAGWNQNEADWRVLLELAGEGSFVAVVDGEPVGTITSIDYEHFTWLGMLLVDPAHRRNGIGSRLLEAAIASAGDGTRVRLDATPEGKLLYDQIGFVEEYRLNRYERTAGAGNGSGGDSPGGSRKNHVEVRRLGRAGLSDIAAYDRPVFGADRKMILAALHKAGGAYAHVCRRGGAVRGYCLGRPGNRFEQIGPIVADDFETARSLLESALAKCADKPVIIDAPVRDRAWCDLIESLGFTIQRPFIRMARGKPAQGGRPEKVWAIAGPELG